MTHCSIMPIYELITDSSVKWACQPLHGIPLDYKKYLKAENHLLHRNSTHYQQANTTTFGSNHQSRLLGFQPTNKLSNKLLQGTCQCQLDELTLPECQYIRHLTRHPEVAKGRRSICPKCNQKKTGVKRCDRV